MIGETGTTVATGCRSATGSQEQRLRPWLPCYGSPVGLTGDHRVNRCIFECCVSSRLKIGAPVVGWDQAGWDRIESGQEAGYLFLGAGAERPVPGVVGYQLAEAAEAVVR